MKEVLEKSSRSQEVKNREKFKPSELSRCRVTVEQYETEEMRMEKAFEVDLRGGK